MWEVRYNEINVTIVASYDSVKVKRMIKSWSIENFKPIVHSGELKLAPVTILAGLNSSGKTSLLQSILMIAQTLSNQVADRPLVPQGSLVELRTFEDILSDFSDSRRMTCMFELSDVYNAAYDDTFVDDPLYRPDPFASDLLRMYKVKAQFSSANENGVSSSAIEASKVLLDEISMELYFEYFVIDGPFQERSEKHEVKESFLFKRFSENELKQFLNDISPEYWRQALYGRDKHNYLGIYELDENITSNSNLPPDLLSIDALDELSEDSTSDFYSPSDFIRQNKDQFQALATLFHFLPTQLLRKVNNYIDPENSKNILKPEYLMNLDDAVNQIMSFFTTQIRYLGPLRFDPSTTQKRFSAGELDDVGSRGEYAAAVYQANYLAQIQYYNPFTRKNEQATLQNALNIWVQYLGVANQISAESVGMNDVMWKIVLKSDQHPRTLPEVGFGVSQILPILVMGLLAPKNTLLIIEQPELHLHPRVQARLGDFFVGLSKCQKQCLIETHSENLVNQLRYHIVEAGGQEKSDCIIYFVDQDEQGAARFEPVEISSKGNILNWPEGFFDETMHQEDKITAASIRRRSKLAQDG